MGLDALGAHIATPKFYSGLVTGALIARTVQKIARTRMRRTLTNGDGSVRRAADGGRDADAASDQ